MMKKKNASAVADAFFKWWTVQDSDSLRSLHKFRQPLKLRQWLVFAGRHLSNFVLVLAISK
ncbi:MAG: hypothetical protein IJ283_01135 [Oscillospiraceae bacterium]|nr:hypothetical protein [Oscillospiraceae bacterium]